MTKKISYQSVQHVINTINGESSLPQNIQEEPLSNVVVCTVGCFPSLLKKKKEVRTFVYICPFSSRQSQLSKTIR